MKCEKSVMTLCITLSLVLNRVAFRYGRVRFETRELEKKDADSQPIQNDPTLAYGERQNTQFLLLLWLQT